VRHNDVELNAPNFEDFLVERSGGDPAAVVPFRRPKRRKPAAEAEPAAPATVADLLLQAIRLVSARRGRGPREVAVREETLLEVLQEAMRRPQQ
jgi:hypothetical protein